MSYIWNMNMTTEMEQINNDPELVVNETRKTDYGEMGEMYEEQICLKSDPSKGGWFYFLKKQEHDDGKFYLYEIGHHACVVPLIELVERKYGDEAMDEDTWEELYYASLQEDVPDEEYTEEDFYEGTVPEEY